MRICFLNIDRRQTCSYYRSGGVSRDLSNKTGALIDVVSFGEFFTDWQMVSNYDIIMIQRPYSNSALALCRLIKRLKIPLWLDYDDNLFCVPPENKAWPIFSDPNVQKDIIEIMKLGDVITVTNEDLKRETLPYNENVVVVPNAFNDINFDVNRILPKRNKTVLWRGSDTHIYDVMMYGQAIKKCADQFPDWEFNFVGFNPWSIPPGGNIKFTRPLDIIDFFLNIYQMAPSVVQVPLQDSVFNRCKSNIAVIEAAYWGATALIPDFWGEIPGTLRYNDSNSYEEMLSFFIKEEFVKNESMSAMTWQWVKDSLLLSNVNKMRAEIIKNL